MFFKSHAPTTRAEAEEFPWQAHEEGQLAVDVAETPSEIIIRAAIAGITEKELDIHVSDDMITIRGQRRVDPLPSNATLHYSECFWGAFSRSVILPCRIKTDEADAELKNGILVIRAPKTRESVKLRVKRDLIV